MSGIVGYDPERIETLRRRTARSLDEIASIDCDDPAAVEAIRALRLTRRNLEDHWMPLLGEITSSRSMTHWSSTHRRAGARRPGPDPVRAEWASTGRWLTTSTVAHRDLSGDELLAALVQLDAERRLDPSLAVDDDLTWEIARRVLADAEFRDDLLEIAGALSVLGRMISTGFFDSDFDVEVTRRLLGSPASWWPVSVDVRHEDDAGAAISHLGRTRPVAALELLTGDPRLVARLASAASNRRLSETDVERFLTGALLASVVTDPTRIEQSFELLALLVEATQTEDLDVGVLRAAINALPVHLPAMAIHLDDGSPAIVPDGMEKTIGSYDQLASFYGQAMADPHAQVVAGGMIDAYLEHVLTVGEGSARLASESLGSQITAVEALGGAAEPVTKTIDLFFVDGRVNEQQRQNLLAGARQSANDGWINLFTVPASVLPGAFATSRGTRTFFKLLTTTTFAADPLRVEPGRVADRGYRFTVPIRLRAATLEYLAEDPHGRGLGGFSPAGIARIRSIGRRLRSANGFGEQAELLRDLEHLDDDERSHVETILTSAERSARSGHIADHDAGR